MTEACLRRICCTAKASTSQRDLMGFSITYPLVWQLKRVVSSIHAPTDPRKKWGSASICGHRTWKSGVNWPPGPRGSAAPGGHNYVRNPSDCRRVCVWWGYAKSKNGNRFNDAEGYLIRMNDILSQDLLSVLTANPMLHSAHKLLPLLS